MVYSLGYRRPPHVDSARLSVMGQEKPKSVGESTIDSRAESTSSGVTMGIPDALSFDRIIAGGTCPVSLFYMLSLITLLDYWREMLQHLVVDN